MSPSPSLPEQFRREALRHAVTDAEWQTRVRLAAAFRLGYHFNWSRVISNHITARIPDAPDRFLMNPYGLGWNEITASSLVTVTLGRQIVSHEAGAVTLAPAGLNFHAGIFAERPAIGSILHCHPMAAVVVGATTIPELMIVHQSGCHMHGEIGYHDFEGLVSEGDEVPRLLEDLGDRHTLMMWNHGLLSVGGTVPEAFFFMRRLIEVCEVQERLLATGAAVRQIPPDVLDFTRDQLAKKKKKNPYSEVEWQSYQRLAATVSPGFEA
jgi:ribulose-5-phosphate 4-epimerase/fuculose-1-phosphate aldolase